MVSLNIANKIIIQNISDSKETYSNTFIGVLTTNQYFPSLKMMIFSTTAHFIYFFLLSEMKICLTKVCLGVISNIYIPTSIAFNVFSQSFLCFSKNQYVYFFIKDTTVVTNTNYKAYKVTNIIQLVTHIEKNSSFSVGTSINLYIFF